MGKFYFDSHQIHYINQGQGELLLILPGNTACSAAYQPQIDYFSEYFHVASFDFLGTGKSDRIFEFDGNWWRHTAKQAASFIDHLGYEKAMVAGSSGGAVSAMFLAADYPDKVNRLVLDSFSIKFTEEMFVENVLNERISPKENLKQFWAFCHGQDWHKIIQQDTENIKRMVESGGHWLKDSPERVKSPVLLLGSKQDSFVPDIEQDFTQLCKRITNCRYVLSEKGDHPLMWTQADLYNSRVKRFLHADK